MITLLRNEQPRTEQFVLIKDVLNVECGFTHTLNIRDSLEFFRMK